jgi:hypothetical protein
VVQLLGAATGTVRRDPFLARQEFEKNIYPKPKERLQHLIDGELNSLNLTLRIRIPDEELINRVMYNAISSYPHMGDFLIPYKTGENRKPETYREFKAQVYDLAKDPLGKRTPVEGQDRRELHHDSKGTKKPVIKSIAIAATAPQVKHRQSEKRVTCQLCGKSGHSAKECFSLKKDTCVYPTRPTTETSGAYGKTLFWCDEENLHVGGQVTPTKSSRTLVHQST